MAASAAAISPLQRLMAEPMALVTVMVAETAETVVAVEAAAAGIEMPHALQ